MFIKGWKCVLPSFCIMYCYNGEGERGRVGGRERETDRWSEKETEYDI